jgi:hypothetical protein
MNRNAARFVQYAAGLLGLVTLGWVLTGQASKPVKHGIPLPTDWSHSHLIFSRPGSAEQLARVSQDPRYWQQLYRREQQLTLPGGGNTVLDAFAPVAFTGKVKRLKRDWSVDLGTGGTAGAENFPAKFSFDSTVASCSTDYVIYSTGLAGSGAQANIVAFNNLYSGCGGTVPSVYWAYNTSGTVLTSPTFSLDGTQVAFVQTNGAGKGELVLVKWKASATDAIGAPSVPNSVSTGSYSTCPTLPCMTTISLRDGTNVATADTTSSVYYDYTNDIAWVGGALGWLHKITGVFKGTPAEVTTGGFPVQVDTGALWISSPVFDRLSGKVFVGDSGGFLYAVDATSAAVTQSGQLDFGTGVVLGPIVDSGNNFVYVFASSDGSQNCGGSTVACTTVYQLSTSFGAGTSGTPVIVGDSVVFGGTPNPLYIGGFDSSYYSSTNATGNLYVCGNTGAVPTLYQIPITAGVPGTATSITTLATPASTASCSPVTDVPNPNTTGGASERLFVSVQDKGRASACSSGGCIFNFLDTPWRPSTPYILGQEILSPTRHIETVIAPGTSNATPPAWTASAGSKRTDGGVTWIDQGLLQASTPNWAASFNYASTTDHIVDSNGNVEVSTTTGISGTTAPSWNTTPGGTTPDGTGTLVWTNAGPVATSALASKGGTSGIISDNIVSPITLVGASQVYFTTLGDQLCPTSGGTGGCAVQASQPALQ